MTVLALSGVLSLGRWWIFIGGTVWLLCAAFFAAADLRAYRRRVTTAARCNFVHDEPDGIVRHSLERRSVGDEARAVMFRSKGASIRVGEKVEISYDPKRPHEVFIASRHPRFARGSALLVIAGIGLAQILYVVIRWGLA
ncbi:DUF3592 domain-containing protein [Streptomyces abikoensis]|uniref:DUF3592 domain-containing protein n=1 Tax=Streptomyces abikoensis TaxID=97398 RepID=A0ABW7T3K7_9ACTN